MSGWCRAGPNMGFPARHRTSMFFTMRDEHRRHTTGRIYRGVRSIEMADKAEPASQMRWRRIDSFLIQIAFPASAGPCGLFPLVSNVLQEPLGGNFPPETSRFGFSVHQAADRGELQALVAEVVVERDLLFACSSRHFAGDEVAIVGIIAPETAFHGLGRKPSHLFGRAGHEGHRAMPDFDLDTFGFGDSYAATLSNLNVTPLQHVSADLPGTNHRHMHSGLQPLGLA